MVLAASSEEQAHRSIVNRIVEPRFDNRGSQVPNMGVSRPEAEVIAAHLLAQREDAGGPLGFLPRQLHARTLWLGFTAGFVGALAPGGLTPLALRQRRPR